MKSLSEITSIALNAITIFIPVFCSINILISLRNEEKHINEASKTYYMFYDVVFVVALSLIFNTKKIIKLGTF